jgi:hypothetical protein
VVYLDTSVLGRVALDKPDSAALAASAELAPQMLPIADIPATEAQMSAIAYIPPL